MITEKILQKINVECKTKGAAFINGFYYALGCSSHLLGVPLEEQDMDIAIKIRDYLQSSEL